MPAGWIFLHIRTTWLHTVLLLYLFVALELLGPPPSKSNCCVHGISNLLM